MTTIKLAIAACVAAGLASAPFAADAKKYNHLRHYVSDTVTGVGGYATAGVSVPVNGGYGSSGPAIGTVTAPSVGSYNWPSVGVTNARPTWSNTNPR